MGREWRGGVGGVEVCAFFWVGVGLVLPRDEILNYLGMYEFRVKLTTRVFVEC